MTNPAEIPAADPPALEDLPEWDLSDLYPGPGSAELEADLKRVAAEAKAFAKAHQGKLAGLNGATPVTKGDTSWTTKR